MIHLGARALKNAVDLASAIKRRLALPIRRNVSFLAGDALAIGGQFDVVFCRAPSFFNYPIDKPLNAAMFDLDRVRIGRIWAEMHGEAAARKMLDAHPVARSVDLAAHAYAGKWRESLERMLAVTGKLFVFVLSTDSRHYGVYTGDTYNHDPAEVEKLFSEYGRSRVRLDRAGNLIVGEIYL